MGRVSPSDPIFGPFIRNFFCSFFYISSVHVIPNLFRNLFPFTLVPSTDPETSSGWQLFFLRPPQSASFRIYFGIFFLYSRPSNRSWNKFRMTICSPSSVIPNLFRNLFTYSRPSYGSWNKFRMTFCSPSSVIPNLFRNLFPLSLASFQQILKQVQDDNLFFFFCHSEFSSESFFSFTLGPSNRSWNKFRMTICSPSSVIPNLFRNLFTLLASLQRILKQVQDDNLWTVGWRTFGPILRTDAFHINFLPRTFLREGGLATKSTSTQKLFIIHTTTKNLWLTDASILGAGEKLPHKTPPYTFFGK